MSDAMTPEIARLLRRAQSAVEEPDEPWAAIETLVRLARTAPDGSRAWLYAQRHLAERVATTEPWRASLLARRVLRSWPDDDGAWGVLALAQSLLGNHRYAVRAYRRALALSPDNPSYAHNLGHLYDAVLDRPALGLPLLRKAWQRLPEHSHVVASYAHALARTGQPAVAMGLLARVVQQGATEDQLALYRWVSERCPPRPSNQRRRAPLRLQRRRRKRRRTLA